MTSIVDKIIKFDNSQIRDKELLSQIRDSNLS